MKTENEIHRVIDVRATDQEVAILRSQVERADAVLPTLEPGTETLRLLRKWLDKADEILGRWATPTAKGSSIVMTDVYDDAKVLAPFIRGILAMIEASAADAS